MNKKGTLFCLLIFLAAAGYFLWSHRHTLLETIFYICASLTALFLLLHCTLLKNKLFAKIAQICLALFALYFIGAAIFIIFKVFILEPLISVIGIGVIVFLLFWIYRIYMDIRHQ